MSDVAPHSWVVGASKGMIPPRRIVGKAQTRPSTAAPADALEGRHWLLGTVTERDFRDWIVTLAERDGWLCYFTHDSRRSPAGFPDLVLVRPPVVIFAELKRPDGHATRKQKVWLGWLDQCDQVLSRLWKPTDEQEIRDLLQNAGRD